LLIERIKRRVRKTKSKTIVGLVLVLAVIFVLALPLAHAPPAHYWRGYRVHQGKGKWVKANLSPSTWYFEDDWVPYCLVITDASALWAGLSAGDSFDIGWSFFSSPKGAIYVDMIGELRYEFDADITTYATDLPFDDGDPGYSDFPELGFGGTAGSDGYTWNTFDAYKLNRPAAIHLVDGRYVEDLAETCADPRDDHFMTILPGYGGFPASGDFAAHNNIVIYFQAHLSLTMMWKYGQAYKLSLDQPELAGTWFLGDDGLDGGNDWTCELWEGSYAFQGAASHFRLASPYAGNVEIQIPIAQFPQGTIEGHKYVDVNADGVYDPLDGDYPYPDGWGIHGTATIAVGAGSITFPLDDKVTDSNGYFMYDGLVEGSYLICEDDAPISGEPGWMHTGTALDGTWTPGPETCVTVELVTGETRTVDFANTLGWPELDIDKTCSGKVLVGGDITFTVILTNTGTQDAEDVEVTDTLPAGVSYTTGATATSGTIDDTTPGIIVWTGTILKDGGTVTITIPVVAATTGEQLNYAEYTAYPDNAVMIHTSASCATPVYYPGIDLTKTADPAKILSGWEVTFTYEVKNTGDLPLTVDIKDDKFGDIVLGESLAVDQTKTFTHTTTIADDITNVATATGTHQLGEVSDEDSASVDVRYPGIDARLWCEPETQPMPGTITWTIEVENIGDTLLDVVVEMDGYVWTFPLPPDPPDDVWTTEIVDDYLPPDCYTNTVTATGTHQLGWVDDTEKATCCVRHAHPKQFTDRGAFDGFTPPEIGCDGLCTTVFELHSGPRIWWEITYFFENSEAYLGEEFDGEGHHFILWDKWAGNLMALDSPPIDFDEVSNNVTLANGEEFCIDPKLDVTEDGYKGYIHPSLDISDLATQGRANITGHIGDQQEGTNPGGGKGSHPKGGNSYDADIRWEIGWLEPGDSAELRIYIAPGKNPGGVLQFSRADCKAINTGPRVRAYADSTYENEAFLYAIDKTVQLWVCFDVDGVVV